MPEIGIPYVLTGPDGTRAVFNDPTDIDFVGYLDSETGITGLLDTADVRESSTSKVEGHGNFQANNYFSRRTGTINGFLYPAASMATVNIFESKIKRASRGMEGVAPASLTWTPSGGSARLLWLWRQGRVTFTGRRPKKYQIPLATAEPYTYSAALNQLTIIPTANAGEAGFINPITNPIDDRYSVSGLQTVFNAGDANSWPLFTITGPITNPSLLNNTTGLLWTLTYTLDVGEYLVVDSLAKSVLLGGTANRYSAYAANFSSNTWWPLVPGNNDLRLLSAAFSTGAQVAVSWRDTWE